MSLLKLTLLHVLCLLCLKSWAAELNEITQLPAKDFILNARGERVGRVIVTIPSDAAEDMRREQEVIFAVDKESPFSIVFDGMEVKPGEEKTKRVDFGVKGESVINVQSLDGVEGRGIYKIIVPATKMEVFPAEKKVIYKCNEGLLVGNSCQITSFIDVPLRDVYSMQQMACPQQRDGYQLDFDVSTSTCKYSKVLGFTVGEVTGTGITAKKTRPDVIECGAGGDVFTRFEYEYIRPVTVQDDPHLASLGYSYFKWTTKKCIARKEEKSEAGVIKKYIEREPACADGYSCRNGLNKEVSHRECPSGSYSYGAGCQMRKVSNKKAEEHYDYSCMPGFSLMENDGVKYCKG
ncbi:hypothetical protein [Aeromonas dhakensis]|uniref:hypothetical protein n=1 Tax=Aeromonas dhakensis TaxID=196024 RepID=UPI00117823F9|nr:hypothetical protein [Aeromonas dhakensis]